LERHAEGHLVRPRRFNGLPYNGINVLMLTGTARTRKGRIARRDELTLAFPFLSADQIGGIVAL
jgi:antirestriction protein ArdC